MKAYYQLNPHERIIVTVIRSTAKRVAIICDSSDVCGATVRYVHPSNLEAVQEDGGASGSIESLEKLQ